MSTGNHRARDLIATRKAMKLMTMMMMDMKEMITMKIMQERDLKLNENKYNNKSKTENKKN